MQGSPPSSQPQPHLQSLWPPKLAALLVPLVLKLGGPRTVTALTSVMSTHQKAEWTVAWDKRGLQPHHTRLGRHGREKGLGDYAWALDLHCLARPLDLRSLHLPWMYRVGLLGPINHAFTIMVLIPQSDGKMGPQCPV